MGDFGGGSTTLTIGDADNGFVLVQAPMSGGARRFKAAENNQAQPLNRVYFTFNYFDNAIVSSGAGGQPVHTEGLSQYTMGIEKMIFENVSIDMRLPIVGTIDYAATSEIPGLDPTAVRVTTNGVGNFSTTIKALLLQMGQTSLSSGLSFSIPTGSDVSVLTGPNRILIDNDALHLMPFIGVYRELGDSWWLQAFTQVDVPTSGNDVRRNGQFIGRLNEQTLLYSDISLGKWLYRNQSNRYRTARRGITGIASIVELHYTSSLNDADAFDFGGGITETENRFDVLNLTMGLKVNFSERWSINVAGVVPLRERKYAGNDRFFDGELSLQINRFY